MRDPATLFFREPRLVATVLFVLVAAGLSAFLSIGRQEDPTITNLFATVVTPYPGADAEKVEALVTEKIETELAEIAEIDTIESTSRAGLSVITIELSSFIPDAELEQAWSLVRDALDDAALLLPTGAGEPVFDDDRTGAFTAIIAVVAPDRAVPPAILVRTADDLADRLRRISGTELVDLYGAPSEEILVEVDPGRLSAIGLSADAVARTIAAADAKSSAGRFRGEAVDAVVEIDGEIGGIARVGAIPLALSPDGVATRVSDVATVSKGARLPRDEIAFTGGEEAVLVAARMAPDRQVDAYMNRIRAEIDAYRGTVADGLELRLLFDQSGYTADRLAEVATNMAIGVGLVIAVLFLTLGIRAAIAVALVLPVTTLASIATLGFLGVSIHQMSVTGLIVALGLLVDAAIVMTDEIRKRLTAGETAAEAVGDAVRRLAGPLFASTVTTALAFMPMALLPGPAGDFVGAIAIAVIVMLVWSFVLALTVTPAIAGRLLAGHARPGGSVLSSGIAPGALGRAFAGLIRLSLARPRLSILYALILPVAGFLTFPTLTAQFFPGVERDQLYVEVEMPPGTAIGATEAAAREIDVMLAAEPDIRSVTWVVGRAAPAFYYNMLNDRDGASDYARALVTTVSEEATATLVPTLQQRLDGAVPDARVLVRDLVQGPPVDAPVELRFVGPELATLNQLGEEARAIVRRVPSITHVRTTLGDSPPKFAFALDEEKVRVAGLSLDGVSRQLDAALEGLAGGSFVEGTEELPVRVRVGSDVRGDLSRIGTLEVVPPTTPGAVAATRIPLSALGEVDVVTQPAVIARRNGERSNSVEAFVAYGVLPEEALGAVRTALADAQFTVPDGYRLEIGGDADARDETLTNLLSSVGLIVTLTIATIVLTFNSFRLAAIAGVVCVLSAGLSLLSLAVFQYPFGIQAVIGVIGSIGVSINAAIVVMTALQADPRSMAGDRGAMAEVVLASSRHIVSTTVTTFGGFLPLIVGGGGFWPPFAMAIAGGVLLSAVVSFFFTPPLFALVMGRSGQRQRAHAALPGPDAAVAATP